MPQAYISSFQGFRQEVVSVGNAYHSGRSFVGYNKCSNKRLSMDRSKASLQMEFSNGISIATKSLLAKIISLKGMYVSFYLGKNISYALKYEVI